MREIKFRMKDYQGYWYYFGLGNATYTTTETLGQYTGLKDKNGVEIYEGDILRDPDDGIVVVVFRCGSFGYYYPSHNPMTGYVFKFADIITQSSQAEYTEFVLIGNVFDNPELQKGGEQ